MIPSIRELYEKDPALYDALSGRDFAAQADFIRGLLRSPAPRALELFAGPARHARALKAAGAEVLAVDASAAMRRYALAEDGLAPADYVRARLPRLPTRGRFDAALLLQYAAGFLEPEELAALLRRLARVLRPGALVVFELRRPSVLRACERPGGVSARILPWTLGRRARLVCPEGPVAWDEDDWRMEMTLRVDILRGQAVEETRRYRMSERLWMPADVRRLAEGLGAYAVEPPPAGAAGLFPQSALVLLRRTSTRRCSTAPCGSG